MTRLIRKRPLTLFISSILLAGFIGLWSRAHLILEHSIDLLEKQSTAQGITLSFTPITSLSAFLTLKRQYMNVMGLKDGARLFSIAMVDVSSSWLHPLRTRLTFKARGDTELTYEDTLATFKGFKAEATLKRNTVALKLDSDIIKVTTPHMPPITFQALSLQTSTHTQKELPINLKGKIALYHPKFDFLTLRYDFKGSGTLVHDKPFYTLLLNTYMLSNESLEIQGNAIFKSDLTDLPSGSATLNITQSAQGTGLLIHGLLLSMVKSLDIRNSKKLFGCFLQNTCVLRLSFSPQHFSLEPLTTAPHP